MTGDPILVADCVGKRYGDRWVLRSASLRAQEGELRVLLGRNGSGKSTLMKIAAGLLSPDTGVVRFAGSGRETVRLHQLAREGVFYLPDHDLLSNAFTVREHLEFFRGPRGGDVIREAAEALSLDALMDARPADLSSGERRRAEVAVAWVRRPRCLMADEPLRHIAPIDAESLLRVFRTMAAGGCAVVITGHEVPDLFAAAHHVTWCTEGTTYELGPPFMARNDERFVFSFLGAR